MDDLSDDSSVDIIDFLRQRGLSGEKLERLQIEKVSENCKQVG